MPTGEAAAVAIEIEAYGKSDIGQVRDGNEDAFAIGFDVAGVEFLTWPVLFFVDVVLLVILWGVAQVVRALCSVVVGR